jgi:hypothetical protein
MAGNDATAAEPSTEPAAEATGQDAETLTPEEEQKRRFREALEAKRSGNKGGAGGSGDSSKIHGTHGKAGNKRQFRRKSGG